MSPKAYTIPAHIQPQPEELEQRRQDLSLTLDAIMATPANGWTTATIAYLRELCGQLSDYDIPLATAYYSRLLRAISAVPRPVRR